MMTTDPELYKLLSGPEPVKCPPRLVDKNCVLFEFFKNSKKIKSVLVDDGETIDTDDCDYLEVYVVGYPIFPTLEAETIRYDQYLQTFRFRTLIDETVNKIRLVVRLYGNRSLENDFSSYEKKTEDDEETIMYRRSDRKPINNHVACFDYYKDGTLRYTSYKRIGECLVGCTANKRLAVAGYDTMTAYMPAVLPDVFSLPMENNMFPMMVSQDMYAVEHTIGLKEVNLLHICTRLHMSWWYLSTLKHNYDLIYSKPREDLKVQNQDDETPPTKKRKK